MTYLIAFLVLLLAVQTVRAMWYRRYKQHFRDAMNANDRALALAGKLHAVSERLTTENFDLKNANAILVKHRGEEWPDEIL